MPVPIDQRFREEFSWPYLERLFRGLFDAHKLAYSESLVYDYPEAVNFEWALRRAKIQTLAHEAAKLVPNVSAVATRGDEQPSPWFHRRIQHGRAILTISAASSPDEVVEPCNFRYQYAQTTFRQRSLFEEDEEHSSLLLPADWLVYALLLQGRGLGKRGQLGFAVIRFPLRDARGYYAARIDLFKEFAHIVAEKMPNRGEQDGRDDLDIDFHEGEDIGT